MQDIVAVWNLVQSWSISTLMIYYCREVWRRGEEVLTATQLHSTKTEPRFCARSNPTSGVSEICDKNLWQWSWLEIRLNAFRRSTIPQKQYIIINWGSPNPPNLLGLLAWISYYIVYKKFALKTLLWSLEFVIQINLDHDTNAVLNLARN